MRGFLLLLFLLPAVLCFAVVADAAVVCVDGSCATVLVPVMAEVIAPPVVVRVNAPPIGLAPRVIRGAAFFVTGRPVFANRLDVRINTHNAAVRVHVNR
jgi:hypothetical protein